MAHEGNLPLPVSESSESDKNFLSHDFIILHMSEFLDLPSLNSLSQLCKETKKICCFEKALKYYATNNIKKLYNFLMLPKVQCIQISGALAIAENPYIIKFIKYPGIFKNFIVSTTSNCSHVDLDVDSQCDVCSTMCSLYIQHINGNKIFTNMNIYSSYVTSVVMTLYH